VLIVFESKYGQSRKIADFIADLALRRGLTPKRVRADVAPLEDLAHHDAVVVVAPIYFGRHPRTIREFMYRHAGALSLVPIVFISVSNAAGSAEADVRASAQKAARAFVEKMGVKARLVATAGGALAYPQYGPLVRHAVKLVARRTGAPHDTSRTHELTDWLELESDVAPFLDVVETIHRRAHASKTSPRRRRQRRPRSHRAAAVCDGLES
jgi:menaquinone-dependent protoporphyrinogen oxidase